MKTSVTELPDSRVRVDVDVSSQDVDQSVKRAARGLAREMRMPGFRKGKAPPELVIKQVGREAVMQQVVRDSLPAWYERALLDSGITPVGDPQIELKSVPGDEGEPLSFQFEVGVRPGAKLGDYKGIEVGKPDTEVPDDVVEEELGRIRESFAKLEPVERSGADGDFLLVDFRGEIDGEAFEGGSATDYLLELGTSQLIEGFEEQLSGASAGDERDVKVTFPDDYQPERLAGQDAVFKTSVKEVREKVLPELDDDFASEASEFDTLEELRGDIRSKLAEAAEQKIESDFRLAAVDAAVETATIDIPDELVEARALERVERFERSLAQRGIDPNTYLQMGGKTREELVEEAKPDAEQELRREAVLDAVAEAEGIEVSDEELVEALAHSAEHERTTPEKLLARLRDQGRDALISGDIRMRKAVDVLAEAATPIEMEKAEAREKLWTPDKEREEKGQLWTPGSND